MNGISGKQEAPVGLGICIIGNIADIYIYICKIREIDVYCADSHSYNLWMINVLESRSTFPFT